MMGIENKDILCLAPFIHLPKNPISPDAASTVCVLFMVLIWFSSIVLYMILIFHQFFGQGDLDEIETSFDEFLITRICAKENLYESSEKIYNSQESVSQTCAICLGKFGKIKCGSSN